jgi:hypothetical protein
MRSAILAVSLATGLSTQLAVERAEKPLQPLQFKEDGTFHISIFSDMHLGMCKLSHVSRIASLRKRLTAGKQTQTHPGAQSKTAKQYK